MTFKELSRTKIGKEGLEEFYEWLQVQELPHFKDRLIESNFVQQLAEVFISGFICGRVRELADPENMN